MAWRAARRKEDYVYPHVVACLGKLMPQDFRRCGNPRQSPLVDSDIQFRRGRPRLHLDEGQHRALSRDQIDFAGRRAQSPPDNLPSLEAQPPGSDAFGLTPPLFRRLLLHPFNSIARP